MEKYNMRTGPTETSICMFIDEYICIAVPESYNDCVEGVGNLFGFVCMRGSFLVFHPCYSYYYKQ